MKRERKKKESGFSQFIQRWGTAHQQRLQRCHVISQTFPEEWLVTAICTRHTFPVNVSIPETKLIQSCLVSTAWEQMELWSVGIFLQMRINRSNCPPLWRYFCLNKQCWTSNKYWHILLLAFLFSRIILDSCPSVNTAPHQKIRMHLIGWKLENVNYISVLEIQPRETELLDFQVDAWLKTDPWQLLGC